MKKLAGLVAAATGIALTGLASAPAGASAAEPAVPQRPVVIQAPSLQSTGPFSAWAPPFGHWGAESKSNAAILGWAEAKVYYGWSVQPGSRSTACVDGWVPWGPTRAGTWVSLGCGKGGSPKGIFWGNYAAVPKIRAKGVTTGAVIQWFH